MASVPTRQPKTRKGKRALEKRAPKQVEDPKQVLILQGNKVSQVVKNVLTDISRLKHGQAVRYTRNNDVHPFEVETSMQFFCERSDCALFCLGNHSKKRPHNLVLGRTFDGQLLDMVELGVSEHTPISQFSGASKLLPGSTPAFVFLGEAFTQSQRHQQLRSLLLDMFQGSPAPEVNAMTMRRVYVCTALSNGSISLRHYSVRLLNAAGSKLPRTVLEEVGPHLMLELRRTQDAPEDLMKEALKRASVGPKKQKNVGFDAVEGKVGRIYMPRQELSELNLVKAKGSKRERQDAAQERKRQRVVKAQEKSAVPHAPDDAEMLT